MALRDGFERRLRESQRLINSVVSWAMAKWADLSPERNEIRQIAVIGLWFAHEKYNSKRGASFSTFARRVMRNRISDHFDDLMRITERDQVHFRAEKPHRQMSGPEMTSPDDIDFLDSLSVLPSGPWLLTVIDERRDLTPTEQKRAHRTMKRAAGLPAD